MLMRSFVAALLALGLLATGLPAAAEIIVQGNLSLSGDQEVPPSGSPGSGTGTFFIDDDGDGDAATNTLSWDIAFQGLADPIAAAHFHAPATAQDIAGAVVDIFFSLIGGPDTAGQLQGSAPIDETLTGLFRSELAYANIHTDLFPTGAIRGQVQVQQAVAEPGVIALSAAALLALAAIRRRDLALQRRRR